MTSHLTHGPVIATRSLRRRVAPVVRRDGRKATPVRSQGRQTWWKRNGRPSAIAACFLAAGRREFVLLGVLYLAYTAGRLLSPVPADAAVDNAHRVIDLERFLHVAPEHTLNDLLYVAPRWLAIGSSYFYETMHYAMTIVTLIWLYRRGPAAYRRARNWLVAMTLPALLSFWLFPVAPPRMISGVVAHDIIGEQSQYGWWGPSGGTAPAGLSSLVNENAAMPSLHVGWAIWVGWNLSHHSRNPFIRAFGYAYPIITVFVVVSTGNHYISDVVAGAVLAGVAHVVVARLGHHLREGMAASAASTVDRVAFALSGTRLLRLTPLRPLVDLRVQRAVH